MADITPNDIINKQFRLAFRGYSPDQVDDFLQQVSDSLYRVLEENQRLRTQIEDSRSQLTRYQETEGLIKNALVLAERTADDVRQRAEQEAEQIRRRAGEHTDTERVELEVLRQTRQRIIVELRTMLQTHLSLLEGQEQRG
ncbi:MAG: DivIVA domain-containing protein [Gammaproteobacteria bacterium]|nr:DivIVA domain-containing protein [Gammaproteobacteria bacterium]